MSSDAAIPEISPHEMEMIRSVLRTAGYSPDGLVEDGHQFNTATRLLMQLVLSGEASPRALAEQLEQSFGRPVKSKVLFAPLLPRYAIQGLPLIRRTAFRPIRVPLRSGESDLQEWENEGGASNKAPPHGSVH